MASRIDELLERIGALEREVGLELQQAGTKWHYRFEKGRVRFEHEIFVAHRRLRRGVLRYLRDSSILALLTAPVIYSLVLPIAILDVWVSLYQAICFRAYGIRRVKRSAYIVFDRHHLAYLNGIEKLNCLYCGYANGVFAFVREVAGRTEQYWCPIRHAKRVRAPHPHYREFVEYGDAVAYHRRLNELRKELAKAPSTDDH